MDLLSGCSYIPAYVSSSIRLTGFWQSSALYLDTTCEDSETAGSDCEPLDWFKEMEVLQTSPCGIPETFKTPGHAGTPAPKFPDPFGTLWDPPQRKRNLQKHQRNHQIECPEHAETSRTTPESAPDTPGTSPEPAPEQAYRGRFTVLADLGSVFLWLIELASWLKLLGRFVLRTTSKSTGALELL